MSSRETTVSSVSREDSKDSTSSSTTPPTSDAASLASTTDVRVKQAFASRATVPAKRVLHIATKRAGLRKLETQTHQRVHLGPAQPGDTDAPTYSHHVKAARKFVDAVSDSPTSSSDAAKVTPPYRKKSPQRPSLPTHSHHVRAARKLDSTLSESATSTEDDVEMQVDFSPLSDLATPRASQAHFSIGPEAAAGAPHVRAASSANERGRKVMPAPGAAIQPQVNQIAVEEFDDDPEDLYGPPVERRIIRILPSLAEELREQQRRVAAEKVNAYRTLCMSPHTIAVQEKRRVPLAPDWILARHVNDPLWKDIPAQGRKRRKPIARKLGENGLNVNELMGCFTVQNWIREHKS
ncbi:hypothetical protein JVT61DRAFT_974 [Boletus reticuloceps]|uniref:Uncharacterized protein n=1 Tax=Boletus reticuloceps TaxID=495285 RepID=A0A8I3AC56_9AGAM|nr:hypothetical protein JVT61DRAFT_974 [Boletus reticuloceps]